MRVWVVLKIAWDGGARGAQVAAVYRTLHAAKGYVARQPAYPREWFRVYQRKVRH